MNNSNVAVQVVESTVVDTRSKQQKAVDVYLKLHANGAQPRRKEILVAFMEHAGLTYNGANTYVTNVKKIVEAMTKSVIDDVQNGTTESVESIQPIVIVNDDTVDLQDAFSMCFCVGEEIVEIQVASTKREARKLQLSESNVNKYSDQKISQVLVHGSPSDSDTKSDVKSKFEVIRIK